MRHRRGPHPLRRIERHSAAWVILLATMVTGIIGCSSKDSFTGSDRIVSPLCPNAPSYFIERVARAGPDGGFPSLALDSRGVPRISYLDGSDGSLKVATRSRGAWSSQVVDAAIGREGFSALAFDPIGLPVVAFHSHDGTVGSVECGREGAAGWSCESVLDNAGDVGHHMAAAFDPTGQMWLAFQDVALGQVKVARRVGDRWDAEVVDVAPGMGAYVSLAFDRIGRPNVGYYRADLGELRLARKNGAAWKTDVVSVGTPSSSTHLDFDVAGRPRMSYVDNPTRSVRHAVRNGIAWTTEEVDGSDIVEGRTSLVSDPSGRVAFAYIDRTRGLRLANRSGDEWILSSVTRNAVGGASGGVSMQLDPSGRLHLTYLGRNGQVMYAYSTAPLPAMVPETIPTPVVPGGGGGPGRESE